MKPSIAITVGDYNGIGPEVALRSALLPRIRRICTPILVGPLEAFAATARGLRMDIRFQSWPCQRRIPRRTLLILDVASPLPVSVVPGAVSASAGAAAGKSIEAAVGLVRNGSAAAVVTAPVSKRALHLAGYDVPGQTEMLQRLSRSRQVAMMLVSPTLRVGLVTIHLPLRDVPLALTPGLLRTRIRIIHDALQWDWGIRRPRIAVLGLNPHAGEDGDLGTEEQRIIIPVVAAFRKKGMSLDGPFPADGFFARYKPGIYDAVVAMYHDQGLIPLKMGGSGRSVNVSAGLPIVRTSPDHGTAFDIAGRGIADHGSMVEAIRLAVSIARNRRQRRLQ